MTIRALGKDIDICHGVTPVADLSTTITGARLHLRNYGGTLVVGYYAVPSAGTDLFVMTLNEHDAASAGNSQALAAITQFYVKAGATTTLAGTEQWARTTQAALSTVTQTAAQAARALIVAFEVDSTALSDGFEWISVTQADPGAGGTRAGGYFYLPYGLAVQRRPDLLPQPNA